MLQRSSRSRLYEYSYLQAQDGSPVMVLGVPPVTVWPAETPSDERWAYWEYMPSGCRMTTSLPYAPPQPADTTVPGPMDRTLVPEAAWKSAPVGRVPHSVMIDD